MREERDDEGAEQLRAYLQAAPQGATADTARRYLEDPRRTWERFAPDFEMETLEGARLSLADLKRRVVVLDFWATWCPPCVAGVPELRDLVKRYPAEELVLVSVSVDRDEDKWRTFVGKQGMTWPQYRDKDNRLSETFGVRAFPTYVVIDGDGIIRQEITGTDPQKSVAYRLRNLLREIAARPPR